MDTKHMKRRTFAWNFFQGQSDRKKGAAFLGDTPFISSRQLKWYNTAMNIVTKKNRIASTTVTFPKNGSSPLALRFVTWFEPPVITPDRPALRPDWSRMTNMSKTHKTKSTILAANIIRLSPPLHVYSGA
jgi:hypothetical protein